MYQSCAKVIGNWFCTSMIFKIPIKNKKYSVYNLYVACLNCNMIFLIQTTSFNWIINGYIGKQIIIYNWILSTWNHKINKLAFVKDSYLRI